MAHIIELIGKMGSAASTTQSMEPARRASTTPATQATSPHTIAAESEMAARTPELPEPDASPATTDWKARPASRQIAENAIVLRRVTKGAGAERPGRWRAMAQSSHLVVAVFTVANAAA